MCVRGAAVALGNALATDGCIVYQRDYGNANLDYGIPNGFERQP